MFVQNLGLRSRQEWQTYCKGEMRGKGNKPGDIPTNPWNIYRNDGWISLGDWLGTGAVAPQLRQYRPFAKARVRSADWAAKLRGMEEVLQG